jgi:hypothetical protein
MTMHNFSRALSEVIAERGRGAQNEFADRAQVHRSKICRLLKNQISCDRDTLDAILNAVPKPDTRRKLVVAYLRDVASPGALLHLKSDSHGQWEGFDFHPLSPKGQAALKRVLTGPHVRAFEKMVLSLDEALS